MKSLDFFTHRKFKREARKIAERIAIAYPRSLALQPDADEHLVIRNILFDEMGYHAPPEKLKDEIAVCCKTVNGLAYLLALQCSSALANTTNLTILQFTRYVDDELESLGFPRQSLEQKEEILNALKLDRTNGKEWDGSTK